MWLNAADARLNVDVSTLSRKVVAPEGSNTYLLTDRGGRIWLLWDQVGNDELHLNTESNLFCATSSDGTHWSKPRRLPVSSLDCDATPLLQQDRRGVFWLLSGLQPRSESAQVDLDRLFVQRIRVVLPEKESSCPKRQKTTWRRWRETHLPRPAFAIDERNVFWLVWQGWLIRSDDASHWQVDSVLRTGENSVMPTWADNMWHKGYYLSPAAGGLLLVADFMPKDESQAGAMLWRRGGGQRWERLGYLNQPPHYVEPPGAVAYRSDGTIVTITQGDAGLLYPRVHGRRVQVGTAVRRELSDRSVPSLHARYCPVAGSLVAFGSKDGIVATVLQKDQAAASVKDGGAAGQPREGKTTP